MVGPGPDGFDRLTGKQHVLHVIFGAFRGDVTQLLAAEQAKQRLPVLSLSSTVAPADIARGAEDDIEFARRMFAWVAARPRTIGLVYFNKGRSGGSGIYELRSKPRGLAFYRGQVRHPRYLASVP